MTRAEQPTFDHQAGMMIRGVKAKLCFLAFPTDGRSLLKVQTELHEGLSEIELTHDQLAGLVLDGVKKLLMRGWRP